MIEERIFAAAAPCLKHRTIAEVVVGSSLLAVALDNGAIGITYVPREEPGRGSSIFPHAGRLEGKRAPDIARWAVTGEDRLKRAIGLGVLIAASEAQTFHDGQTPERPFGVAFSKGDVVGMVGYIRPVEKLIRPRVKEMIIFDEGIMAGGDSGEVTPTALQAKLLPTCDVVFLTGTTVGGGTLASLLAMSVRAREIILIGASTPLYPEAFRGTGVTVLAGSRWRKSHREAIFKKISQAGGIACLKEDVIKTSLRIQE